MRSTNGWGDLTTRARIRAAALARFPLEGFAAATIRSIAQDAGVSPALVLHHFGSKDGLRRACDAYVVAKFRETKLAAMEEDNLGSPGFAATTFRVAEPLMKYFAWALVRGHEAADDLFDEMLREAREVTRIAVEKGMVKGSSDLPTRTALHMTMMLGMIVLHKHVERNTGIDPVTAEGIARITPTLIEIFSGLFDESYVSVIEATYRDAATDLTVPAG